MGGSAIQSLDHQINHRGQDHGFTPACMPPGGVEPHFEYATLMTTCRKARTGK